MSQAIRTTNRIIRAFVSAPTFVGVSAVAFVLSAVATALWSQAMSSSVAMIMPGGWTMSMAWMRMPGQTWLQTGVSFVGMWIVMMVAMMLPSLMPMLYRYRQAMNRTNQTTLNFLTGAVALGYFFVWTFIGIAVFPMGACLAAAEMHSKTLARAVPEAVSLVLVSAGAFQFSKWKAHQLACCRGALIDGGGLSAKIRSAWGHGMRLGVHCFLCCFNLMAILLVVGVMDLRVMSLITVGLTAERVIPDERKIARAIGVAVIVLGWLCCLPVLVTQSLKQCEENVAWNVPELAQSAWKVLNPILLPSRVLKQF